MTSTYSSLEFYFVAFLDLLGFSDMVKFDCESPSGSELYMKKLFDIHEQTLKNHKSNTGLEIVQFSDSIVLAMPFFKDNFQSFIKFYQLCIILKSLAAKDSTMNLIKRYAELLKSVFDDNLVSIFLFGSVARREDTKLSDIDIMTILKNPPTSGQLKKLGKIGRFYEIIGRGEFHKISCVVVTKSKFLEFVEKRAPREAINPLREAVVMYDKDFISGLKNELESGAITLKIDAHFDYLRYGDIRRSYLVESARNKNKRDARSDSSKAATHYLRAYFLYKYYEMILSVKMLRKRIEGENRAMALLYEKIMEGDYDRDFVDAIREWVVGRISRGQQIPV